jgi:hypothetical protein
MNPDANLDARGEQDAVLSHEKRPRAPMRLPSNHSPRLERRTANNNAAAAFSALQSESGGANDREELRSALARFTQGVSKLRRKPRRTAEQKRDARGRV